MEERQNGHRPSHARSIFLGFATALVIAAVGALLWYTSPEQATAEDPSASVAAELPDSEPQAEAEASEAVWCQASPDHDCGSAACASGKRIIVFISADWCGWCRHMKTEIFPDPEVRKILSGFSLIEVVAEKNEELIRESGIESFPTWIIVDAGCESTIDMFTGATRTPEEFMKKFSVYQAR